MDPVVLYIVVLKAMTLGLQSVLIMHAIHHLFHMLSGRLYLGIIIGYAGYCLIAISSVSPVLSHALFFFVMLSSISPLFFWLLTNSLYQEKYQVNKIYWLILAYIATAAPMGGVIYGIGVSAEATPYNWSHWLLFFIPNGANAVFLILGFNAILNNWRSDLVESRRWLWVSVVPFVGVTMLIPLLIILFSGRYIFPLWAEAFQASYIFLVFFTVVLWLLETDLKHLLETKAKTWLVWLGWHGSDKTEGTQQAGSLSPNMTSQLEQELLERLNQLITSEKYFRQHKLTVSDLAVKLDLPEQQLRKLINQNLGFRNFNDFVNHYRIEYVIEALKNPEHQDITIMSLALDAGFNSIAPFNRAFKEKTGLAPNEYRSRLSFKGVSKAS